MRARWTSWMPYAAGLATALLLSGCGGSVPPTGPATAPPAAQSGSTHVASSGTPTTSATTAVEDPVLTRIPKAARLNTQAGAEAFAKFFIQSVAKSWVEADPAILDGLFTPQCKACGSYAASAEKLRADGLHHDIPALFVKSATANSIVDGLVIIGVPTVQKSVAVVDGSGQRSRTTKPDEGTFVLTLERRPTHWVVVRAQVEKLS